MTFKLSETNEFIKNNFEMILLQKQNFNDEQYKQLIKLGFLLSNLTIDDDYKVIFKYKHWDVSTDIRPYELNELGRLPITRCQSQFFFRQKIIENHIISLLTNTDTFKSAFRDFKLNSIIN